MELPWLLGFMRKYPETLLSLACFLFFLSRRSRDRRIPTMWPVVGAIPGLLANAGRFHDWVTEFLDAAGLSLVVKSPWGSPVDMLVTADPANVAHIFTSNFGNYPKGEEFARLFDVLGDGIFNADGESWAFQRRKAHALMADARFRAFTAQCTERKLAAGLVPLLDGLAASGARFDMQDVFMRLTFDLTATFMFGADPGCLAADFPSVPFARAMDEAEEILFYRHITPIDLVRLQSYLKIGHHKRMAKARRVLDKSIAELIARRREQLAETGEPGADLLSSYMACQADIGKDGAEFDKFLRDTTLNLMVAGRDTTSSALTWFFWLLSRNPRAEAEVLAELRAHPPAAGDEGYHTPAELKQLVYLHAALSDSLRLFPPVPFEHKAAVEPDMLPSGVPVGPRRRVIVSFYSMGRMEAIWGKDCGEFRPERWLTEAGRLRHEPACKFVAFNVGPRLCLGKELAFTQMKAAVAAILRRFRVEVADGFVPRPKLSIILHMKEGLKVRVHKREQLL